MDRSLGAAVRPSCVFLRSLALADRLMPVDAGAQDLDRVALPPIVHRKNLHFVRAAIAGRFHPRSDQRQIDDAVPHHAPVEQQVAGGDEPVAKMEGEKALVARALNLILELRMPSPLIAV